MVNDERLQFRIMTKLRFNSLQGNVRMDQASESKNRDHDRRLTNEIGHRNIWHWEFRTLRRYQ